MTWTSFLRSRWCDALGVLTCLKVAVHKSVQSCEVQFAFWIIIRSNGFTGTGIGCFWACGCWERNSQCCFLTEHLPSYCSPLMWDAIRLNWYRAWINVKQCRRCITSISLLDPLSITDTTAALSQKAMTVLAVQSFSPQHGSQHYTVGTSFFIVIWYLRHAGQEPFELSPFFPEYRCTTPASRHVWSHLQSPLMMIRLVH